MSELSAFTIYKTSVPGTTAKKSGATLKKNKKKVKKTNTKMKRILQSQPKNLLLSEDLVTVINDQKSFILKNGSVKKDKKRSEVKHKHIKITPERRHKKSKKSKQAVVKISSMSNGNMYDDNEIGEEEEPPQLVPIPEPKITSEQMKHASSKQIAENYVTFSSDSEQDNTDHSNEDSFIVGENMLKHLIFPVDIKTFFRKHWEKVPLYVERGSVNYFSSIISTEKLDEIIRKKNLFYNRNVDVVTYENGTRETIATEGKVTASALWDLYANGCSVRVLNPQTYCTKLHALISSLQEYFGCMVGANLYLTPPGSQGFAPHYDDIEAFVMQIEGRKHWKLYYPRDPSADLPRYSSKNFNRDELGSKMMDVTLNAGDTLYFRRGVVHEACTDDDAHSLHITLSVYQKNAYVDLLEAVLPAALKEATRNDKEFREGLPLHYLRHLGAVNSHKSSSLRKDVNKKLIRLLDKLKDYLSADAGADQLGKKFMHDAMPPYFMHSESLRTSNQDGERLINGEIVNRVEFDLDTEVRLLRYHCLRLVEEEGASKIYYCTENANVYHGEEEQFLEIIPDHNGIIIALQENYPDYIKIVDLPFDDDIVKVQVVSDLWEHGLIVTKYCLPIIE